MRDFISTKYGALLDEEAGRELFPSFLRTGGAPCSPCFMKKRKDIPPVAHKSRAKPLDIPLIWPLYYLKDLQEVIKNDLCFC